jgi:hypothetical protein
MAIFRSSPTVGAVSGTAGSSTFALTRFGGVLRQRQRANHAQSKRQISHRAIVAGIAAGWQSLTDEQRRAWGIAGGNITWYTTLAKPYHPTGWNLFTFIHSRLERLTPLVFTDPPQLVNTPPLDVTSFDVDASRAVFKVFFTNPMTPFGIIRYSISHPNTSAPRTFVKDWKFLQNSALLGTQSDLIGEYTIRYGPLRTGETVGLKWVAWDFAKLPAAAATQIFTA